MATSYRGRVQVKGTLNRGKLNFRKNENLTSQILAEIPDGTEFQLAMYSEKTDPNLTETNNDWNYWGWSKYVKH